MEPIAKNAIQPELQLPDSSHVILQHLVLLWYSSKKVKLR